MAGEEIQAKGWANNGLRDRERTPFLVVIIWLMFGLTERFGMEWVHQYIGAFGGDPTKVIMSAPKLSFASINA